MAARGALAARHLRALLSRTSRIRRLMVSAVEMVGSFYLAFLQLS